MSSRPEKKVLLLSLLFLLSMKYVHFFLLSPDLSLLFPCLTIVVTSTIQQQQHYSPIPSNTKSRLQPYYYFNNNLLRDSVLRALDVVAFCRTTFDIKADTHLDLMNIAEQAVLDGTSKWSCKIAITGQYYIIGEIKLCLNQKKKNQLIPGPVITLLHLLWQRWSVEWIRLCSYFIFILKFSIVSVCQWWKKKLLHSNNVSCKSSKPCL